MENVKEIPPTLGKTKQMKDLNVIRKIKTGVFTQFPLPEPNNYLSDCRH